MRRTSARCIHSALRFVLSELLTEVRHEPSVRQFVVESLGELDAELFGGGTALDAFADVVEVRLVGFVLEGVAGQLFEESDEGVATGAAGHQRRVER